MSIFKDASYKGIAKKYAELEKNKNSYKSNTGGFFSKSSEKKYKRAVDTWEEFFVKNKKNSPNIRNINKLTFDVNGDVTKAKDFSRIFNDHSKCFKDIISKYTKVDKFCMENSILRMFNDIHSVLTTQKYISAFKVAYEERSKSKGKPYNGSISDMLIMCHQILVSFEFFCMGTINMIIIEAFNKVKDSDAADKDFLAFLNEAQNTYKALICDLGYIAIDIVANLEAIKNPADEFKKAIKIQKESSEKIAKSNESFDIATRQSLFFKISEEAYLEDKSEKHEKGSEDAVVVAVIVAASIIGFFLMIKLIRRAIYLIGTIKTDIGNYVMIDVATITMNIQGLKEKLMDSNDPAEKKRLENIIKKQEAWVAKFKDTSDNFLEESTNSAVEARYVTDDEDNSDESQNYDGYNNDSSNDDYEILM